MSRICPSFGGVGEALTCGRLAIGRRDSESREFTPTLRGNDGLFYKSSIKVNKAHIVPNYDYRKSNYISDLISITMKKASLISYLFVLISCGPSKQEIEAKNKYIQDSIEKAKNDSLIMVKEQEEKERIHKEKIEVGKSIKKNRLLEIQNKLDKQLSLEKDKLTEIQKFQFGRSSNQKNQQINAQYKKIYELEEFIKNINSEIAYTNLFNSFDFQSTPEGTIEYLFYSAKNSDFSKVRHLLDPYGEYDNDALGICLVTILPKQGLEEWHNMFANARIMGKPILSNNEDEAEIEIATGPSSNKLEKIILIKRMDRWYIKGF